MAIEKFLVSRHETHYQAWPCLAQTQSGKLISTFAQCQHHGDRSFARFVTVESTDLGRTWSEPRVLVDNCEGTPHWNCPRVSALRDGRLVLVGDLVNGSERLNPEQHTNWLWFSDDDGVTWSERVPTPAYGIVPDKIVELSTGRWLLGTHAHDSETGNLTQRVWWSDDQGETWGGPGIVGRQQGLNLCEVSIIECSDGLLVAFLRENSGLGWDGFKSFSSDGGETWDGPYHTVLCGCHRPVAGWLQSGRLMVTYRFIQGGQGGWGKGTQNFFAAAMDEASVRAKERRGQWARILPLDFDRHAHADLGYSGWVQTADGELIVVTYLLDDWPRGQIRGYRLSEAEFGEFAEG